MADAFSDTGLNLFLALRSEILQFLTGLSFTCKMEASIEDVELIDPVADLQLVIKKLLKCTFDVNKHTLYVINLP